MTWILWIGIRSIVVLLSLLVKEFCCSNQIRFLLLRNENTSNSEESRSLSNNEDDIAASVKPLEVQEHGEEENAQCSSQGEFLNWKLEDVDAPKS